MQAAARQTALRAWKLEKIGKPKNVVSFGMNYDRIHMDKNHVTRRPEVSI